MAVRLRLTRVGSKKNPIWRVVVADQRSPRDGRFIETIGHYNPQTSPSTIVLDDSRVEHWLARGAVPTNTVKNLIKAKGKAAPAAEETAVAAPEAPAEPAEEAPVATEEPAAPAEEPAAAAAEPAAEAAPGAGSGAREVDSDSGSPPPFAYALTSCFTLPVGCAPRASQCWRRSWSIRIVDGSVCGL